METPRKPLNKYWCSVPHYLSDIRNLYIKQIKKENKFNFKEVFVSALKSDTNKIFNWYLSFTENVKVEDRTLKRHISMGVFVVYIDTGSSVPGVPSKSRNLADENNKILTEWKWFETTVLSLIARTHVVLSLFSNMTL
jgi:hypothetical protein